MEGHSRNTNCVTSLLWAMGTVSYTEVCKMAPYGPAVFIPKEDCIGHVTKRMGTALRKLTTTHKGEQIGSF